MSLKKANPTFNFITISNKKGDWIDADYYIELPTEDNFKIKFEKCLLAYYYYNLKNPFSKIKYKLFKYYDNLTEVDIKEDLNGLGKVSIILIFEKIDSIKSAELIKNLNIRHLDN
jgi:hypothetical protein